ncbi:MerR family transcriptional regulator [Herbidospora galbida]|uniref:MerR family transcriptional regulator n=1 Tax=Herbidospora galbida TaxID=2575442 RepID=A0A4U3MET8_9ACTN|nr:MerR family transcriptional regulator [Herbidospora galbida]TKK86912.1 MerR family transcriptional regulator [Herbidospora galbida]
MAQRRRTAGEDTLTHGRIADTAEPKNGPAAEDRFEDRFDDEDYPAYSMGAAADMLGVTPTFLRALGVAKLIEPLRSSGGHRRYSRYQLRLAARARELVDQGTPVEAACRIIILEDQLAEALRINQAHQRPAAH